ncbi:MAG: hypothetical protein BJ554DRAFT_1338, partial [Olpidium bornovanus]
MKSTAADASFLRRRDRVNVRRRPSLQHGPPKYVHPGRRVGRDMPRRARQRAAILHVKPNIQAVSFLPYSRCSVVSEGADETRERLDAIFATDEVTPSGLTTTALLVGWRAKPRAAYSSTDEDPFGIPSSRPCPSIFLRGTAASEPMPPEIPELRRCLIYGSISAPPGHDNAYHDGGLPTLYLYATELTDPRYFAGLFAMEQDLSSFASPRSRPPAASVDADLDVWLGDLLGSDDDGSSDHSPLPPWHASEDLQRKFESM